MTYRRETTPNSSRAPACRMSYRISEAVPSASVLPKVTGGWNQRDTPLRELRETQSLTTSIPQWALKCLWVLQCTKDATHKEQEDLT